MPKAKPKARPAPMPLYDPPSPLPEPHQRVGVAATLVLGVADGIIAMCRKKAAPAGLQERLLHLGGECLARGGGLEDALAVAKSELDALCPEEAPPWEG